MEHASVKESIETQQNPEFEHIYDEAMSRLQRHEEYVKRTLEES